jgi:peptidyl-prolyl cis-trans isomerase C
MLSAQAPHPKPSPPPKPSKAADPSPDTVLATLDDGSKVTYGELKALMAGMTPAMAQAAMRDRRAFVTQYALMRKLTRLAEAAKLDQVSPTKELLAFGRMQLLTNAEVTDAMEKITVPTEELQKYYEANKERYKQVRVKAIYVSFHAGAAADPEKKYLTEPEARAKIEKILADIRGGADFVAMVKQHSEDETSAGKEGDFGNLRRTDNLPEAVRQAIFALKSGEVSEPVRQPNGFYLFRAEQVVEQSFAQVRDEIFNEVKQARFRQWMEQTQKSLNIKFEDEAFFNATPAAPPAAK